MLHHLGRRRRKRPGAGDGAGRRPQSIFQRRHRLTVRRELLRAIVLGVTEAQQTGDVIVPEDSQLMAQLEGM